MLIRDPCKEVPLSPEPTARLGLKEVLERGGEEEEGFRQFPLPGRSRWELRAGLGPV